MEMLQPYLDAVQYIKDRIPQSPTVGIILGSGLGELAEAIEKPVIIPYKDIPNFCISTAIGHKGNLIIGSLGGKTVVAMQGRFHYYEGYSMQQVTFPVRVMAQLGIKTLFVSNAAGGVNRCLRAGDLMIIRDHINLLPNPLVGKNHDYFGTRFPDMTRPYDPELMLLADRIGKSMGLLLRKGVYQGNTGPSYETPAEYAYAAKNGADAVGMSTVPEVIVARHCGLRVFGMSVITNEGFDFAQDFENNDQDVIEVGKQMTRQMSKLFTRMIEAL